MRSNMTAKLQVFASMFIFGTIGVFVRHLSLPSSIIALCRGVIGVSFLLILLLVRGRRPDLKAVKKNLLWLFLSGSALGFNWILLFESYRYTSVAVSTLCYYMAPILVILLSPILLKERLTGKKLLCVALSLFGMVCISGVMQEQAPTSGEVKGIFLGLTAAVLYAAIVLMNKDIKGVPAYERTILQLGISAVVLFPYCVVTQVGTPMTWDTKALLLLLLVSVVHTGLAYYLYFGALDTVSGQTAAMISYLDPVVAVLASVIILKEHMLLSEGIGAVLILGAALLSEINIGKKVQP